VVRGDTQAAPERGRALVHAAQPVMTLGRRGRRQANAIVLHRQSHQGGQGRQPHHDVGSLGVFEHVGQGFLSGAPDGLLNICRQGEMRDNVELFVAVVDREQRPCAPVRHGDDETARFGAVAQEQLRRVPGRPGQFAEFLAAEIARWKLVIETGKITAE